MIEEDNKLRRKNAILKKKQDKNKKKNQFWKLAQKKERWKYDPSIQY